MIGTRLNGMGAEISVATHHVIRYTNHGSHQCSGHVRRMRHMLCAHCNQPGECEHMYTERCHCFPEVVCADCLFEAEGGLV